jgi:NAD(P)-dependent dehydrogenase (short-subunit alcohol dehydrogenase family)
MTDIRVDGKVVLLTGGTQGIGEAVAREAAASGAKGLCITGRDAARGAKVAKDLEASGCPTLFVAADLSDAQACRTVAAKAWERFGIVEGLVNAAGLTDRGTIENTSVELWDKLFDVNARAPFILMQETVRRLQAAKRPGSIVNIITRSSHGGQPFLTAYSSSKGALAILTKNVAHAVRHHRIRVNGLNMGWAETPGEHAIQQRDGRPKDWLERAEPTQPFGRILKPKDIAVASVYLLSDASEMMTGALIDFDQNVMGAYD